LKIKRRLSFCRLNRFFVSLGTCAVPKPRARGVASGLVTRSRWLERYAPFSLNEKEMVLENIISGSDRFAIHREFFLAGILLLPMLVDGAGHPRQPVPIFAGFQDISRGKKLDAISRRIAKWFQQLGRDERGNIMRLAVQHPRRLLRREAGGQLAQQHQEFMLVVAHISSHFLAG
jgi:hypothetical protein